MELHYKAYQKIRIYLDKIKYALPNLNIIKDRTILLGWDAPISNRFDCLRLIQAELIDFCLNLKDSAPYVPPSRCKSLIQWYGSKDLQCPMSLSTFQNHLFEADKFVIAETNYILKDEYLPPTLTSMFKKNLECYGNAQWPKQPDKRKYYAKKKEPAL